MEKKRRPRSFKVHPSGERVSVRLVMLGMNSFREYHSCDRMRAASEASGIQIIWEKKMRRKLGHFSMQVEVGMQQGVGATNALLKLLMKTVV